MDGSHQKKRGVLQPSDCNRTRSANSVSDESDEPEDEVLVSEGEEVDGSALRS